MVQQERLGSANIYRAVTEPKIILISGHARAGKDSVGDRLVETHGFKKKYLRNVCIIC